VRIRQKKETAWKKRKERKEDEGSGTERMTEWIAAWAEFRASNTNKTPAWLRIKRRTASQAKRTEKQPVCRWSDERKKRILGETKES